MNYIYLAIALLFIVMLAFLWFKYYVLASICLVVINIALLALAYVFNWGCFFRLCGNRGGDIKNPVKLPKKVDQKTFHKIFSKLPTQSYKFNVDSIQHKVYGEFEIFKNLLKLKELKCTGFFCRNEWPHKDGTDVDMLKEYDLNSRFGVLDLSKKTKLGYRIQTPLLGEFKKYYDIVKDSYLSLQKDGTYFFTIDLNICGGIIPKLFGSNCLPIKYTLHLKPPETKNLKK